MDNYNNENNNENIFYKDNETNNFDNNDNFNNVNYNNNWNNNNFDSKNKNNNDNLEYSFLDKIFRSKNDLYEFLKAEGNSNFYLPSASSKCITIDYLVGILKGQYFCLKNNEIKKCPFKLTLSKFDYYSILSEKINYLGYNISNLSNKEYLRDIIYTIDNDNFIFQKEKKIFENDTKIQIPNR